MCVQCSGTYILQGQTPKTSLLAEPPQTPLPSFWKKKLLYKYPGRPQAKYAAENGPELLMFLPLLPSNGIINMYYIYAVLGRTQTHISDRSTKGAVA